jgi:hypothetical protein
MDSPDGLGDKQGGIKDRQFSMDQIRGEPEWRNRVRDDNLLSAGFDSVSVA